MLTDALPIPDDIWRRLREFLEAGKTGQVTLHVSEGHVLMAEFTDRVRVCREDRARVAQVAFDRPTSGHR